MPRAESESYFKVTISRVPPEQLGTVMASLAKLGFADVGFDLVTDVPAFRSRSSPEISSHDYLRAWVQEHPTFKAIEAVRHLRADGRTNSTTYTALRVLCQEGVLKKMGEGRYSLANIKAIAGPKSADKAPPAPRKTWDKNATDLILTHAKRNHGRFNTLKLVEMFRAEGRARNSVYASIDALMKSKMVKRVGETGSGQYILLAKAKAGKTKTKAGKAKPGKAKAAVNGHDVGAEVAANG